MAMVIQACKKRKSELSSVLNIHSEIKDDKLSTTDTSNIEDKPRTQFWNESANESNSDIQKGKKDNENELDLEVEKSITVSQKVLKKEIQQNKEGKTNFVRCIKMD